MADYWNSRSEFTLPSLVALCKVKIKCRCCVSQQRKQWSTSSFIVMLTVVQTCWMIILFSIFKLLDQLAGPFGKLMSHQEQTTSLVFYGCYHHNELDGNEMMISFIYLGIPI